jgi:hypothetical protein
VRPCTAAPRDITVSRGAYAVPYYSPYFAYSGPWDFSVPYTGLGAYVDPTFPVDGAASTWEPADNVTHAYALSLSFSGTALDLVGAFAEPDFPVRVRRIPAAAAGRAHAARSATTPSRWTRSRA